MAKFRMTVNLDNAAFQDEYQELARIIAEVSEKVGKGYLDASLRDINGKLVGMFSVELDEDEDKYNYPYEDDRDKNATKTKQGIELMVRTYHTPESDNQRFLDDMKRLVESGETPSVEIWAGRGVARGVWYCASFQFSDYTMLSNLCNEEHQAHLQKLIREMGLSYRIEYD